VPQRQLWPERPLYDVNEIDAQSAPVSPHRPSRRCGFARCRRQWFGYLPLTHGWLASNVSYQFHRIRTSVWARPLCLPFISVAR